MRLKSSTVFVAGAGGLGSPCSIYLAAAGVGKIRICDKDAPDVTNLNRQILHNESRLGINKAFSANVTLKELNPHIEIEPLTFELNDDTMETAVQDSDIIVDCLDNFPARYALNRFSVKNKIPLVHGAVHGFDGQVTFIKSPETPCFECMFPDTPPKKEIFPVLGAVPGIIGTIQALEAIKYIVGTGDNMKSRLLVMDGLRMTFREVKLAKNRKCKVCG